MKTYRVAFPALMSSTRPPHTRNFMPCSWYWETSTGIVQFQRNSDLFCFDFADVSRFSNSFFLCFMIAVLVVGCWVVLSEIEFEVTVEPSSNPNILFISFQRPIGLVPSLCPLLDVNRTKGLTPALIILSSFDFTCCVGFSWLTLTNLVFSFSTTLSSTSLLFSCSTTVYRNFPPSTWRSMNDPWMYSGNLKITEISFYAYYSTRYMFLNYDYMGILTGGIKGTKPLLHFTKSKI